MTPELLAIRRRLFQDFAYYAEKTLYIRTKDKKIEKFKLNSAQRILLDTIDRQLQDKGRIRLIILKGRQMGLSTAIGGWLYWWVSQRHAEKAMVVTHKGDATKTLFEMTKRFHDKMEPALKPHDKYSNAKELVFDKLDSSYALATAGGDGIGRSETITAAHLSELAFWPKSSAQATFSGLMDTIPPTAGTAVFIESTANGVSGLFYDQCQAARGFAQDALGNPIESDFEFIFLPWTIDNGYRLSVSDNFKRTPVEEELVAKHGVDDEQLMFRRKKIAEKGVELFKQEFPFDADEAFLTSGRPVFHSETVAAMIKAAKEPLTRKTLVGEVDERDRRTLTWEDHVRGELLCYLPHDPAETYYVGADVGAGVQRDYSVAQVFDSQRRQAAVWRGQIDPDYFGTTLAALGRLYNEALIICERNNHGILTNRVVHKDEAYPNVYQETVLDKVTDTETTHVGFLTSEKSKPLVIDKLRANVRDRTIELYDRATLQELQSFVVTETGKMAAEKGCHDDCVISLALADHINEGVYMPIENQDDWYVELE